MFKELSVYCLFLIYMDFGVDFLIKVIPAIALSVYYAYRTYREWLNSKETPKNMAIKNAIVSDLQKQVDAKTAMNQNLRESNLNLRDNLREEGIKIKKLIESQEELKRQHGQEIAKSNDFISEEKKKYNAPKLTKIGRVKK